MSIELWAIYRESKNIVFRENLFSQIWSFQNFRVDQFSLIQPFKRYLIYIYIEFVV